MSPTQSNVKRWCPRCGVENLGNRAFCTACGMGLGAASAPGKTSAGSSPGTDPGGGLTLGAAGRHHSPAVAMAAGLLIPGAGQAYNGHPIAGFFVLMTSVLVLPWLIGAVAAYASAGRMAQQGGRSGMGGMIWIVLQAWLALNVALAVVLALTMTGVLR